MGYNYDVGGLTKLLNQGKELWVKMMVGEGFITEEQGRDLVQNHAFVVKKKGLFGKTWDRVRGVTTKDPIIDIVKDCAVANISDYPSETDEDETETEETPETVTPSPSNRFDLE